MERELSGPIGVDVGTPPGASEIGQPVGHSNLYVKNLPPDADEPALWSLFSQCGTIEAGRGCSSLFLTSRTLHRFLWHGCLLVSLHHGDLYCD